MSESQFISEARQIAAQCWCDDETKDRVMDPALAEAFARRLAGWMEEVHRFSCNADFYRRLLDQCADNLGVLRHQAFVQDDGGIVDTPLRLKIPGLVAELANRVDQSSI